MVIDIKMCRFDNVPWGFRLVGGSDFDYPLTVVKVTEGSIAEEAGLQAGDVIVRVNDTPTSPLTHEEANQIIRHCGNVFFLGVYREDEDDISECKQFPILGMESRRTPDSFLDVGSSCRSPMSMTYSDDRDYMPELADRPCSVLSENAERKLVEEEIAAVLSGESEVLKEHNVMGIQPKAGVCMSSDVLRSLNEEITKTKAERDKENRKWTTFLQKPNRPIPKSKVQIEAEKHAANAYKVRIVKSAPRLNKSPNREIVSTATLAPINESSTPSLSDELRQSNPKTLLNGTSASEPHETADYSEVAEENVCVQAPTPTDSEVPSLEDLEDQIDSIFPSESDNAAAEDADVDEVKIENEAETNCNAQNKTKLVADNNTDAPNEDIKLPDSRNSSLEGKQSHNDGNERKLHSNNLVKTEEELALERQLADVQRQLIALSSLPSTIQSTLDAVTKQLAELLPAFKLQQTQANSSNINGNEPKSLELEKIDESNQEDEKSVCGEQELDGIENFKPSIDTEDLNKTAEDEQCESKENGSEIFKTDISVNGIEYEENGEVEMLNGGLEKVAEKSVEVPPMSEEVQLKKEKKHEIIEELQEHLDRKRNPKRSKRAFGPLTPSSERPVVLPGGRRWYRPKDAYNDEFIAETLSSQAELITGTTLGEYHSKCVTRQIEEERVNFMKYQKPEKKIDLNRSEVYKVIHHLDRQPVRGIEVRAPIVAAEADIIRAVQS